MHLLPIKDFLYKNMHVIKKKEILPQSLQVKRFSKVMPNVGGNTLFWGGGVINPKTYLIHEFGSNFFPLNNLACKLVNLLGFEKISCKMSKDWFFSKIIGPGFNCTYEFEVRYRP